MTRRASIHDITSAVEAAEFPSDVGNEGFEVVPAIRALFPSLADCLFTDGLSALRELLRNGDIIRARGRPGQPHGQFEFIPREAWGHLRFDGELLYFIAKDRFGSIYYDVRILPVKSGLGFSERKLADVVTELGKGSRLRTKDFVKEVMAKVPGASARQIRSEKIHQSLWTRAGRPRKDDPRKSNHRTK
jgi:hypothetical protein